MTHGVPSRNWSYPTAIKFGVGRISELAEHAKSIGLKRPLLVTDKALRQELRPYVENEAVYV